MSHHITNQQKLNDVIFAGRNQEYGAYAIRSSYGNTIFKSLSFMLAGVGSVFSVAFYLSHRNDPDPSDKIGPFIHDSVYVIPVTLPEDKTENKSAEENHSSPAEKKTNSTTSSLTIVDSTANDKPDTLSKDPVAVIITTLSTGSETGSGILGKGNDTTGGKPGGGQGATEPKGYGEVDSGPEFEGGLAALYRFVASHLKYPETAYDYGKEGTVYVKFVVDESGKVGRLTLLNTAGWGMDDEALRVVGLIPKFKSPAKVKGEPVKVYYQLPIRFKYK